MCAHMRVRDLGHGLTPPLPSRLGSQAIAVDSTTHKALGECDTALFFVALLDECCDRMDYEAVLVPCLQCLRNLAASTATAQQLCGADIVRKLADLLAARGSEPPIASGVLAVLANVSLLPDIKGNVAGAVLDKTFLAMRTGRSHVPVTREATHLLRSLSAAPLYQTTVFRNVGILMAAAETYHNDAGIQESCLAVFRNLATNGELRKALLSSQVLELGYKTMTAHYGHAGIQVGGAIRVGRGLCRARVCWVVGCLTLTFPVLHPLPASALAVALCATWSLGLEGWEWRLPTLGAVSTCSAPWCRIRAPRRCSKRRAPRCSA